MTLPADPIPDPQRRIMRAGSDIEKPEPPQQVGPP